MVSDACSINSLMRDEYLMGAGTLLGSIALGAIADATSNHVALAANALLMLVTSAFFAMSALEVVHLRVRDSNGLELRNARKAAVSGA